MIGALKKTATLLQPDRLGKWLALASLAILVSGFELVGASLVFALLSLAAEPEAALNLPLVGDVRRFLPSGDDGTSMVWLAALTAVFFILRAALLLTQSYWQSRIAVNAGARMSTRLLQGYLGMPYAFHLQRNSADLIRNVFQAVEVVVQRVLFPAAQLAAETLVVVALVTFLLLVEPASTSILGLVMAAVVAALLKIVNPWLKSLGQRMQDAYAASLKSMQQSLQGIRDLHLLGRREHFIDEFYAHRNEYARASYLGVAAGQFPRITIETTLVLFILAFLGFAVLAADETTEALASLGILAYVGLRVQPSLQKIVQAANSLRYADAALGDLDRERHYLRSAWSTLDGSKTVEDSRLNFQDRLRLRDVSYTYEGSAQAAVSDIDIDIIRGESVGICGPTGGGKSTLIDLLLGLLEPDAGSITVDGRNIHADLSAWHRELGVVSQNVFLLDDTLRRNIAFGLPDRDIDDCALRSAVSLARLDDLVQALPEGLDSLVGERGVRLSGGQRQRVAIARALYRDPSVVVLDEGTSALDGVTEMEFIRGIETLRGSRTLVMVAHRLETIRRCDTVLLVAGGRIVDRGTYDELSSTNEMFRAMGA